MSRSAGAWLLIAVVWCVLTVVDARNHGRLNFVYAALMLLSILMAVRVWIRYARSSRYL